MTLQRLMYRVVVRTNAKLFLLHNGRCWRTGTGGRGGSWLHFPWLPHHPIPIWLKRTISLTRKLQLELAVRSGQGQRRTSGNSWVWFLGKPLKRSQIWLTLRHLSMNGTSWSFRGSRPGLAFLCLCLSLPGNLGIQRHLSSHKMGDESHRDTMGLKAHSPPLSCPSPKKV